MSDAGVYAAKSVIIVVFLVVGFRLLGKREMAQLTLYDLAMLMALSNAVQNAMTGGKGALGNGLIVSSAVIATGWLVTRLIAGSKRIEEYTFGTPVVVVNHGTVLSGRLRKVRLTQDDLLAAIRAHGLEGPHDVALAVLEVDGSISVVPR